MTMANRCSRWLWYPIALGAAVWQRVRSIVRSSIKNYAWSFYRAEGNELLSANVMLGSASGGWGDEVFWRDPFTNQFINFARTNADRIKEKRLAVEDAQEKVARNGNQARRNRENLDALTFAARRLDHLGRRYEVMQKFSDQYWDAYLNLGDRTKVPVATTLAPFTQPARDGRGAFNRERRSVQCWQRIGRIGWRVCSLDTIK